MTASNPPELPVFSVFAPKEEVVETPAAEVVQPEVIKEKKVDEAAPAPDAKGGKPDAKAASPRKADAKK